MKAAGRDSRSEETSGTVVCPATCLLCSATFVTVNCSHGMFHCNTLFTLSTLSTSSRDATFRGQLSELRVVPTNTKSLGRACAERYANWTTDVTPLPDPSTTPTPALPPTAFTVACPHRPRKHPPPGGRA